MPDSGKSRGTSGLFCSTIFLSAFLIFQVQPLISKYILPWFGGTPGVWSACLLFFQTLLFAGYAYAHFSIRRFRPKTQAIVHWSLLGIAVLCLPIIPDAGWKPVGSENPTWRILCMLATSVGIPYFVLSSTGPLLQAWFSRTQPEAVPYRLYALSNIGSMLGLVTYPFLFEPLWTTTTQAAGWSFGFLAFAIICGWCAWQASRANRTDVAAVTRASESAEGSVAVATPAFVDRLLWFGLSACASVMLLAMTNQVCLDVAVIPFLWVLPLSLYLLSFILVFDHEKWYPRDTFTIALTVAVACVTVVTFRSSQMPILPQLIVDFGTLFVCCMVCHGELVKLKPQPSHLTSFYLATAAGGAAGGLFVALLAPVVFERLLELQLGLIACCVCVMLAHRRHRSGVLSSDRTMWLWCGLLVACIGLFRMMNTTEASQTEVAVSRNFYGVLRVLEERTAEPRQHFRTLVHGRTEHGRQFLAADRRRQPTTYYGETSGVGLALQNLSRSRGIRGGFVGMGVGTLATYGKPNDVFRFYEIDPDIVRLAETEFSFLRDSDARIEIVLGDARLSLEREAPQNFDLLVLDAFSSDAIPVHLLTREAMTIYRRHLRNDGVLAIHISNRFFDLRPIVTRLAEEFGFRSAVVESVSNPELSQFVAHWMLLSKNDEFWARPALQQVLRFEPTKKKPTVSVPLWTDQFSNLLSILK